MCNDNFRHGFSQTCPYYDGLNPFFECIECLGGEEGHLPPPSLAQVSGVRLELKGINVDYSCMDFILNIVKGCYSYMASCTN